MNGCVDWWMDNKLIWIFIAHWSWIWFDPCGVYFRHYVECWLSTHILRCILPMETESQKPIRTTRMNLCTNRPSEILRFRVENRPRDIVPSGGREYPRPGSKCNRVRLTGSWNYCHALKLSLCSDRCRNVRSFWSHFLPYVLKFPSE